MAWRPGSIRRRLKGPDFTAVTGETRLRLATPTRDRMTSC